jgi:hypothetical protein
MRQAKRYAWVLSNVDGIVCAFDSEPSEADLSYTLDIYHEEEGEFGRIYADTYTWTSDHQSVKYTLIKTDLL